MRDRAALGGVGLIIRFLLCDLGCGNLGEHSGCFAFSDVAAGDVGFIDPAKPFRPAHVGLRNRL